MLFVQGVGEGKGNKGRRGGRMQRKEKKEEQRSSRAGKDCGLDFPGKLFCFPIDFGKTKNGISLCWERGEFKSLSLGGQWVDESGVSAKLGTEMGFPKYTGN